VNDTERLHKTEATKSRYYCVSYGVLAFFVVVVLVVVVIVVVVVRAG